MCIIISTFMMSPSARMRSEGYSNCRPFFYSDGLGTRLGLSVCLPVCLSVDAYSGTTGYEAAYELYKLVQIYTRA